MSVPVRMPVITEAGEEAVVTAWFVDEGKACAAGQLIAEVQAEKVASEVVAPTGGFVVKGCARAPPIRQDSPICEIAASVAVAPSASQIVEPLLVSEVEPAIKASPAAKRMARELGVDLADIRGSGPEGRVTEQDVRNLADPAEGMAGLRAVIARNMRRSHVETVPVTLFATADFGPAGPTSITARVVHACATALAQFPDLNGTRRGDVFTAAAVANIAVAIQTDDGLVAPVIADAASHTLESLVDAIRTLGRRSAEKTLNSADYEGGTFTVSNLGGYGVEGFTPVINLPQVAILGVGALRQVLTLDPEGLVTASQQLTLSLTFDHAFIDGAPAAVFLRDVVGRLSGS